MSFLTIRRIQKIYLGGASYEKEIDYLKSKGITSFEKTEDGYWESIKEEDANE